MFQFAEARHAARGLIRTPTISLSAILCLALGIGTTTAIASAVERALLSPLPFADPESLVAVHRTTPHSGPLGTWPTSAPNYVDMSQRLRQIQNLAAIAPGTGLVTLRNESVQAQQLFVTANLFDMLGARSLRGRLLTARDGESDQPRVVVVSSEFWRTRLGSDESVVGTSMLVDGQPAMIVGVAQPDLRVPHGSQVFRADLWMPLVFTPANLTARRSNFLFALGRLAPGATTAAADADVRSVFDRIVEENVILRGEGVRVAPLQAENVATVRTPLLLVSGAVVLVLLIACTNVAALLLARGVQRRRELAIRTALGASRWDTVRLSLLESALVTAVGTVLGLGLAALGVRTIGTLAAARLPQLAGLGMDARIVGFALILSVIVAFLCGAVPAWRGASVDPQEALGTNRGSGAGRAHHRALRLLVTGEIATSLILLVGAGLLLRTFSQLMQSDPGFETDHVLTMRVTLSPQQYTDRSPATAFLQPVIEEIRAIPGVQAAGAISVIPYAGWGNNGNIRYEGVPKDDPTKLPLVEQRRVSPSFFEATGQTLVSGRFLAETDGQGAPTVVVVNRALVARDFNGKDPVGKRFHLTDSTYATIVGVVSDIRNSGPFSPPTAEMYGTYQQFFPSATGYGFMVRVRGGNPVDVTNAVRNAIRQVDPTAAVARVAPMREVIATSLGTPRVFLMLIGTFAAVAIVLAAAGLYGILSYSVAQRTREFGIRLALGSRPSSLVRMVTSQGMMLVGLGVVIGLAGSAVVTRFMGSILYGLSPLDITSWIAATALLLLVGSMAAIIPAMRVTRVDPIRAIQTD